MSDSEVQENITSSANNKPTTSLNIQSDSQRKKKKASKRQKTSKGGLNVSKSGTQLKLSTESGTLYVGKSASKRKVPDERSKSSSGEDSTEDEFLNCSDSEQSELSNMDTASANTDMDVNQSVMFKTIIAALQSDAMKQFMDTYIKDSNKKLVAKVTKLETKLDNMGKELKDVKEKLNVQEQSNKNKTLWISGLEEADEDVENTLNAVKNLCKDSLGIVIPNEGIYSTYRIGKKQAGATKARNIVVNFHDHKVKMDVYNARTKLRKIPDKKNLYINEDLTKMNIELLKETKKRVNRDISQTTWTSDGFVYLRLEEKGTPVKIENMTRLDFYLKPKPKPSED